MTVPHNLYRLLSSIYYSAKLLSEGADKINKKSPGNLTHWLNTAAFVKKFILETPRSSENSY